MKVYLGLVGKEISHSKSPVMYKKLLKCEVDYTLFDYPDEFQIDDLDTLFSKCTGISVTSPYKKHFLDKVHVDENVKFLNAINCLYKANDKYYGTNTDYYASMEILDKLLNEHSIERIYILGNGPMARMICSILKTMDKSYTHLTRENSGDLSKHSFVCKTKSIIINGCSREFIFSGEITGVAVFWDLNYNMAHSSEISNKALYIDGLELLYLQAELALPFWNLLPYKKI